MHNMLEVFSVDLLYLERLLLVVDPLHKVLSIEGCLFLLISIFFDFIEIDLKRFSIVGLILPLLFGCKSSIRFLKADKSVLVLMGFL